MIPPSLCLCHAHALAPDWTAPIRRHCRMWFICRSFSYWVTTVPPTLKAPCCSPIFTSAGHSSGASTAISSTPSSRATTGRLLRSSTYSCYPRTTTHADGVALCSLTPSCTHAQRPFRSRALSLTHSSIMRSLVSLPHGSARPIASRASHATCSSRCYRLLSLAGWRCAGNRNPNPPFPVRTC